MQPSYQQTEVGNIPIDWQVLSLPKVLDFIPGKAHEQFISEFGTFVAVNSKFVSTEGTVAKYATINLCPAKAGDILMVMSDLPNGRALAKCFLVDQSNRYAVNQRVCILRAKAGVPDYFFFQLNRNPYFLAFDDGVSQTHLLNPAFRKCPIIVPSSVVEQQAIAKALGDVDGLIAALEALIAKKRDIKQGAMQELLSGHRRTTPMKIGDVLRVRHGRSQWEVTSKDGAYPILASGGQIGNATRFLYDKPSVLIGRKGTIDRPQFAETPFWTIDTLFYTEIFEPNVPKYVFYKFCMIDWRHYNEASGVPSLNAGTIENVEIHLHEPDEQKTIALTLADMDAEIAALEAKLAKTRDVKQGMMQVLLTGEVRLV